MFSVCWHFEFSDILLFGTELLELFHPASCPDVFALSSLISVTSGCRLHCLLIFVLGLWLRGCGMLISVMHFSADFSRHSLFHLDLLYPSKAVFRAKLEVGLRPGINHKGGPFLSVWRRKESIRHKKGPLSLRSTKLKASIFQVPGFYVLQNSVTVYVFDVTVFKFQNSVIVKYVNELRQHCSLSKDISRKLPVIFIFPSIVISQ